MKNHLLLLAILFGMTLMFSSCEKDDDYNEECEAVLICTGDYAVDGCGFFVKINGNEYKPENESIIDFSFPSGSGNVLVRYQLLYRKIETTCGFTQTLKLTDGIKIISISKK